MFASLNFFKCFKNKNEKLSNAEIKNLPPKHRVRRKDVLKVCNEDVSKWNDCWGKIVVDHACDPKVVELGPKALLQLKNMVFFMKEFGMVGLPEEVMEYFMLEIIEMV